MPNKDYITKINHHIDRAVDRAQRVSLHNRFYHRSPDRAARDIQVDLGMGHWVRGFTSKVTVHNSQMAARSMYLAARRSIFDEMMLQCYLIELDRWISRSKMVPPKLLDQAMGTIDHRRDFVEHYSNACEAAIFNEECLAQQTLNIDLVTGNLERHGPSLRVHFGHAMLLNAIGRPQAEIGGFFVAVEKVTIPKEFEMAVSVPQSELVSIWPEKASLETLKSINLV